VLSRQTGIHVETIRYYEKIGLLSPPRTEDGHRLYTGEHLNRLTFIHRSRGLGFDLDEIGNLLSSSKAAMPVAKFRKPP
jgi:MerR family transcriptional regulator, mercuric resistance operon regulatory protein